MHDVLTQLGAGPTISDGTVFVSVGGGGYGDPSTVGYLFAFGLPNATLPPL